MKLKTLLLGSTLLVSPMFQAFADSCRANSSGGQDTTYNNGIKSNSRANSSGGQDTRYSDGRKSTSRPNSSGGMDTRNSR